MKTILAFLALALLVATGAHVTRTLLVQASAAPMGHSVKLAAVGDDITCKLGCWG